jgi:hypothetical protein
MHVNTPDTCQRFGWGAPVRLVLIMSADTGKLTAIICRWVRAIGARFKRPGQPHPELYGLPAGRVDSIGAGKERLSTPDVSSEHAQATQAYMRLAHPVADFAPNLISTIFFGLGKRKN